MSYDNLVGTRARNWGQREFQVPALRDAGVSVSKINLSPSNLHLQVSEEMLHSAFPDGIPGEGVLQGGLVDLTEDEEVKTEVKKEEE